MLRVTLWLTVAAFGLVSALAGERIIDFSKYPLNKPPPGFRSVVSGQGKPGDWKIILDGTGPAGESKSNSEAQPRVPVLAQLSQDATDEHFPMLVFSEEAYGDFKLATRLKIVDGLFEQMAGVAFRVRDTNNYYYVRASALGRTFKFIKVVNGQRLTTIGPTVPIARRVWHDLTVECKGNRISILFDGKALIPPLNDNTFMSGKVAFWTKSDSVSYFGETTITYTPHETLAQILIREALRRYPRLRGLKIYSLRENETLPKIIASTSAGEVGTSGGKVEQDVIARDVFYYGKQQGSALVTLPLHDRNGEVVGAVRVVMQSFAGQTEQNALARAQPVVREMEKRIRTARDLLE